MTKFYKIFLFLAVIKGNVGVLSNRPDTDGLDEQEQIATRPGGRFKLPSTLKRWRTKTQNRPQRFNDVDLSQQDVEEAPPKPPRGVLRDEDDLIDTPTEEEELENEVEDEGDIKCIVEARRPYAESPTVTLTGIKERFNSLLIGYDTHSNVKRANKASLYGWSGPKTPDEDGVAKFTFDLDYVSILPQGGMPLSFCALVFVPPIVPKFDMRMVFGKPAMSVERYFASEEHLVRALKKKSKKVTSCCFIAYPIVTRR